MVAGKKRIVFNGFTYEHGMVHEEKLTSTCFEQTRKNAVLSQIVVAVNQSL